MKRVATSGEVGDRHLQKVTELPAYGRGCGEFGRRRVGGFLAEEIIRGSVEVVGKYPVLFTLGVFIPTQLGGGLAGGGGDGFECPFAMNLYARTAGDVLKGAHRALGQSLAEGQGNGTRSSASATIGDSGDTDAGPEIGRIHHEEIAGDGNNCGGAVDGERGAGLGSVGGDGGGSTEGDAVVHAPVTNGGGASRGVTEARADVFRIGRVIFVNRATDRDGELVV